MKAALTGDETLARVRQASALTDLRAERRLVAKLDMSGPGIARRISAAAQMLRLCLGLAAVGRAAAKSGSGPVTGQPAPPSRPPANE